MKQAESSGSFFPLHSKLWGAIRMARTIKNHAWDVAIGDRIANHYEFLAPLSTQLLARRTRAIH